MKAILNLPKPDGFANNKKTPTVPTYFMSYMVREDFMKQLKGGIIFYYITFGKPPIDFVIFAGFISDWPPEIKTREAVKLIRQTFDLQISGAKIEEAEILGLDLPKAYQAKHFKFEQLSREPDERIARAAMFDEESEVDDGN